MTFQQISQTVVNGIEMSARYVLEDVLKCTPSLEAYAAVLNQRLLGSTLSPRFQIMMTTNHVVEIHPVKQPMPSMIH